MADQDGGETKLFLVFRDHTVYSVLADRIKPGGRFVKENDLGVGYQGPCQRHPFFHSPGKLRRVFVIDFIQIELFHLALHQV